MEQQFEPDDPGDSSSAAGEGRGRRSLTGPLIFGLLLGLFGALAATIAVMIFTSERLPPLTEADLLAAVQRWEATGPADYDLDLELRGNRPSKIHVEVRDGEITHMLRDGVEPSQRRTWYYWSVAGQLDTIGVEMEMARNPAKSFGAPGATEAVQWAEFDKQYGYPRRYRRVVMGANFEVDWNVTRFQPLTPASAHYGLRQDSPPKDAVPSPAEASPDPKSESR